MHTAADTTIKNMYFMTVFSSEQETTNMMTNKVNNIINKIIFFIKIIKILSGQSQDKYNSLLIFLISIYAAYFFCSKVLAYLTFSMTRTPKYNEKIMLKNSKHDIMKKMFQKTK